MDWGNIALMDSGTCGFAFGLMSTQGKGTGQGI